VVGSSIWRDCCTRQSVSDMATILDEAFAFMLVENYWDEWSKKKLEEYVAERSFDETTSKQKKRKVTWGKYTKGALGAHQYYGWNQDGINRFNHICQEVKEDREKIP